MRLSNSLKDIIEYLPYNPIFCKEEYGVLTKVTPSSLDDINKEGVTILLRGFEHMKAMGPSGIYAKLFIYENYPLPKSFLRLSKVKSSSSGIEVIDDENLFKFFIRNDYTVEQYPEEYNTASVYSLTSRIDWLRRNLFDYKSLIPFGKAFDINYKNSLT